MVLALLACGAGRGAGDVRRSQLVMGSCVASVARAEASKAAHDAKQGLLEEVSALAKGHVKAKLEEEEKPPPPLGTPLSPGVISSFLTSILIQAKLWRVKREI